MASATIKLEFRGSEKLDQVVAAMEKLASDPSALALLLKGAVKDSLLVAYKSRYDKNYAQMMRMERVGSTIGDGTDEERRARLFEEAQQLGKRAARLRKKSGGRDTRAIEALERQVSLLSARAVGADPDIPEEHSSPAESGSGTQYEDGLRVTTRPSGLGGALSSGLFEKRMRQIMQHFIDEGMLSTTAAGGKATVGIGNTGLLDKIRTPSHGEVVRGRPTKSRHTMMWRQLEFGTGVYAKSPFFRSGPTTHKTKRGSWWYGVQQNHGIHLRGSRPGNILFNPQSLPYDSDAIKFEGRFAAHLRTFLFG